MFASILCHFGNIEVLDSGLKSDNRSAPNLEVHPTRAYLAWMSERYLAHLTQMISLLTQQGHFTDSISFGSPH